MHLLNNHLEPDRCHLRVQCGASCPLCSFLALHMAAMSSIEFGLHPSSYFMVI